MATDRSPRSGQSTTETILLLPLYLLFVFGLLQMGQLGTALLVANYAAASIARQVVMDGRTGNGSQDLEDKYKMRFNGLMTAGMKFEGLKAEWVPDSSASSLLSNVTVHACAQINAYPFVGHLLNTALKQDYSDHADCAANTPSLGPFFFNAASAPPYYSFVVHGRATARMNYQP